MRIASFRKPPSLLLGGVLLAITACGTPPPNLRLPQNLPVNGDFERGLDAWGTGYIEDSVRRFHPPEESLLPYWVSPSMKDTNSRLYIGTPGRGDAGKAAKIDHVTEKKAQHYGTLSQRVTVKANTHYELEVWTRYEGKQAEWFVTAVREWEPHENLPDTAHSWKKTLHRFTTGKEQKEAEIRFVIQGPGTYWIDDVALFELTR